MYIEIRKSGKKKKYYLAHSFREGNKISKVRRYLGQNLSPKELEGLKKRAEILIKDQIKASKMIKDPFRSILSHDEVKSLNQLIPSQKIAIKHLSEKDWMVFTELFTYDTNAIEGSTLEYSEVKGILEKEKWPVDASKGDIAEAYGVANAINHIRNTRIHISLELLKDLHKIVFSNSKTFGGRFRPKGVEVGIRDKFGNIVHRGAPSRSVVRLLKDLVDWYQVNKKKYQPIILAAVVHNQFENIHPFQDGNGRVGRLLLNNILLKHNFPPVNIEFNRRQDYYAALQAYQNSGDIRPMVELILKEYKIPDQRLR